MASLTLRRNFVIALPLNIGEALHECADPWPRNCPIAISNSTIGNPISNKMVKYGIKNAVP